MYRKWSKELIKNGKKFIMFILLSILIISNFSCKSVSENIEKKQNTNIFEYLNKKKKSLELSKNEIYDFTDSIVKKEIPDYQIAAMLMAINLNGMTEEETYNLTMAMKDSGGKIDFSYIDSYIADKHSTGGVGDDTSLILVPLLASCNVKVPMVSGRGLGHTGGTLDKLESIPGFNSNLNAVEFKKCVDDVGASIIGATSDLAPADKILYTLRDVTCTVDSIPLAASSILSKKLAAGTNNLVLDVKTGSGAVIKDYDDSVKLAKLMVETCKKSGVNAVALVTDMNEPLSTHVGNSLAIENAINILSGKSKCELLDLSLTLGSYMLKLNGIVDNVNDGVKLLNEKLESGEGLEKFRQIIKAQNGNEKVCDDTSILHHAKIFKEVKSIKSGYISAINTESMGYAASLLGAGRITKDDIIDYGAGYIFPYKIGDYIDEGQVICTIYANDEKKIDDVAKKILSSITFSDVKVEKNPLIYTIIE